jgi:hypothetical protein
MSWMSYVFAALVTLGLGYFFTMRARRNPATKLYMDRQDPRKHWAQAAMALYQGDKGDPGYWRPSEAQSLLKEGWSTPNQEELMSLLESYVKGECNVAFDKLRIIWLARVGLGAGWIDEAASWEYVFAAQAALQETYGSWEELRVACAEGRDQWYDGKTPESQVRWAEKCHKFAAENYFRNVAFS